LSFQLQAAAAQPQCDNAGVPTAVQLSSVYKVYRSVFPWDRRETVAVDGVSLSIPRGEIFGLLGPNGAGKTTVVKMIAGLVLPDRGTITFPGMSPRHRFGAVLEGSRNLYWRLSVAENIDYFGRLKGIAIHKLRPQSLELLELFGIGDKLNQPAQTLSRGMQQKLAIVLALLGEPELLLLDEPTLGLDLESALSIQEVLRELVGRMGVTVVLTTHQMDLAESLCREVAIMRRGRVALSRPVAELTSLLKRSDYVIRLPEEQWQRVQPALQQFAWQREEHAEADSVRIRFALAEPRELYAVMEALGAQSVELQEIYQERPTLEQVFLEVASGRLAIDPALAGTE
jgi:ABC-2 type transport system ATP-binding protein